MLVFALDVYGNGKTFLRGGYGYYFGRIPNANILQVYLASGGPNSQLRVSSPGATTCQPQLVFPNIFPSGLAGALQFAEQCGATTSKTGAYVAGAQTSVAYLDPHLQNPQVQEIDMAIEQNLGNQTVISVSYLGSLARELASAVDRNLALKWDEQRHVHRGEHAVSASAGLPATTAARRGQVSADPGRAAGDTEDVYGRVE